MMMMTLTMTIKIAKEGCDDVEHLVDHFHDDCDDSDHEGSNCVDINTDHDYSDNGDNNCDDIASNLVHTKAKLCHGGFEHLSHPDHR